MTYYVIERDGLLELRQDRLRAQRHTRGGEGHPHDICAVTSASRPDEMRDMIEKYFGGAENVTWEAKQ